MAKVLTSIAFDQPSAPVSAAINDTFTFAGTPGFTGSGGTQRYDFKWEVDDGGGYVTIAAATGLTTAGTNPVVNTNSQAQQSITVTCAEAGSYTIRMAGAPTSGGSYTVLSSTQTVTVSAGAHTGTGAISVPSATVAGSGTHVANPSGTGAISVPAATVAGAGSLGLTATGAVTVPAPTVSGTGTHSTGPEPVTGTGAITVPTATVAGVGTELLTATGAITVSAVTVSGVGVQAFTATGAVSVPSVTVSGTGTHTVTFTGSGAITAPAPTVTGTGTRVGGMDPGGSGDRHGFVAGPGQARGQAHRARGLVVLPSPDDTDDLIASGVL